MKLYFLRHGDADWPGWDRPDDERPLTKKGKKEVKRVASFLSDLEVEPGAILTSPLPRAYETAEIVATELDLQAVPEPALAPGFDNEKLRDLLKRYEGQDVMLVGHEPSLSEAIAALTGANVKFPKGALARVDLTNPNELQGQLAWLVPPKAIN